MPNTQCLIHNMLFSKKRNLGFGGVKSSLWIIIGIILVLLAGSSYIRAVVQKSEIQSEINRLKAEKERLEMDNKYLSDSLDFVASDSYVERVMRSMLGMQKFGEKVVIISRSEENKFRDSASKVGEDSSIFSNIKKWKEYFFGK